MHVLGRFGFKGQEVDFAPALVGRGQSGIHSHITGTHAGDHVQNAGLDVFVELKLQGLVGHIHVGHVVLAAVLDDAFVAVGPSLLEQSRLGGDVVVGVQNQDFALGFGSGEIVGHLAGALVRAGRATVRRQGNGHGEHTAIGHGFELFAQSQGLLAGLPGVHHLLFGTCAVHAGQGLPHEVHTRRDDQAVISQLSAAGQFDDALVGVDGVDTVLDDFDAMTLGQVVIRGGDVGHRLAATEHQVGDGARDEGAVGLNQSDLDFVVRPHAQVFGCRGTRITTTNDHDFRSAATTDGGTTRNHSHGTQCGAGL